MTQSYHAPGTLCTKAAYSKKEAQTVINARLRSKKHRPEGLRAYQCDECNLWHLTHRNGRGMKS